MHYETNFIEITTLYLALAYAINGTKEVFVHKEWNAGKYGVSVKPKTIVLLDEDEDVLAFGKAAKDMFSDILCRL